MPTITEIAPDIYRINTFIPEANLGFSQFLVVDDEPLLFHSGMRGLFPVVRGAVSELIDPSILKWIAFSHFEADECGSLNEWHEAAPDSAGVCSMIGKMVSVDDFAPKNPAKGMNEGEILETGKRRFRFMQTPHVPHCWEAGMLFEETTGTLFCSDIMHQEGDVEPTIQSEKDVLDRARQTMINIEASPLANYFPYREKTDIELNRLAALQPKVLATMHGSIFQGDGASVIKGYNEILREVIGGGAAN
jgi:flavorubredoxin